MEVTPRLRKAFAYALGLGIISIGAAVAAKEPAGTEAPSPVPVMDIVTAEVYAEPSMADVFGGAAVAAGTGIAITSVRKRQ